MSTNRPAFANSLVAMYGSSPETSDDEDSDSGHKKTSKLPPESKENSVDNPQDADCVSEEAKDLNLPPSAPALEENTSNNPDSKISDALSEAEESVEDSPPVEVEGANQQSQDRTIPDSSDVQNVAVSRVVSDEDNALPAIETVKAVEDRLPTDSESSIENIAKKDEDLAEDTSENKLPMPDTCGTSPDTPVDSKDPEENIETSTKIDTYPKAITEISQTLSASPNSEMSSADGPEHDDRKDGESSADTPILSDGSKPELANANLSADPSVLPSLESNEANEEILPASVDTQIVSEHLKPDKELVTTPGGRRLRQVRHPSVKAAEAAADAAFVAAVTPTRKNLKEAKIASARAKVSDSADVNSVSKKNHSGSSSTKTRKGRSASSDRKSPLVFSLKEDSNSHEKSNSEDNCDEEKLSSISEEITSSDDAADAENETTQKKSTTSELEKPVGIKMKISRESVQILDPHMSKLEVQIPSETTAPEFTASPGGTKRLWKLKEGTISPVPPLSPITLKIAKSKEGLEVVSTDNSPQTVSSVDSEGGRVEKIEKITLKLSRDEGATIVKPCADESVENRQEKLTLKLVKGELSNTFSSVHSQDDDDKNKLEKITLKLSKGDGACIVKRKETDVVSSSSDQDTGKLERITLKLSSDNNVSIKRPKDVASQLDRGASASPEPGKIEKITLKVSKHDNVSIVKPSSPTPSSVSIEKLTLKVSKDGTAAVSGKSHDEHPRDGEGSKLEKITLKLSKDDGVSIVKPASPVLDRKTLKLSKDEPLSPLSPLIISRGEDVEPQKERITLKLAKAGGHPSPVGVIDERSSWSIKSTDSDNVPSPVTSEPATPKSRPKRTLADTLEGLSSSKRLKLSEVGKSDEPEVSSAYRAQEKEDTEHTEEEIMDVTSPQMESDPLAEDPIPEIKTDPSGVCPKEDSMDVIQLDSEDSQGAPPPVPEPSVPVIGIESEVPTPRGMKRKPRGRPRKSVLPPGAVPPSTPIVEEAPVTTPTKAKREKIRVEPVESDRPKRSCKGREKPPPKPPKATKPRGRAALNKLKAEQIIQPEEPQLFEEETRMSADQSEAPAPDPLVSVGSSANGLVPKVMVSRLPETHFDSTGPNTTNDESQASQGSVSLISSTTESTPNRGNRKGRMEIDVDPQTQVEFTVDMIAEYVWPLNDGHGETYMIQEQISTYLGVKSFKRKYPNMQRRTVDHDERQYLLERRLVSETLCDLGLTALPSHEVLDVLCTDFPEKFEEYRRYTREKVQREFSNKQKAMLASGTKEDSKSKAMRNMASFNSMLNRSRRDQRRCCFDLQSFTVHYPENRRRNMGVPNPPRVGPYPLALVPGQYTDYYKEYTAAELRYFPVNTVLYGPLLPHEMMRSRTGGSDGSQTESSESSSSESSSSDSDSSGSDSDSDSDTSSESGDDSSSQVGQGTVDNQEEVVDRPNAVCRVCNGDKLKNKLGRPEALIHCASCEKSGHLSCLDLTVDMMPHIRKYSWHCTDCKLCAQCNDTADEDKMLFCDMCDRGYHIYCVGLRKVPEGRWHCKECALCASCGARDPGGTEEHQAIQNLTAQDSPTKTAEPPQWQHEFKKGDKGTRVYVRTLCVPCSKLWRKGRYCRLCWKCFTDQPEEEGLINCSICDRWMHAECCRKAGRIIDVEKLSSYICELCQQKGARVSVNKSPSKVLR
ncbi:supporter of activation of yellow protein isoform X1 [Frankliniella occidentalis]|uniref:PHD finger protein 10 n=1 Tax=Frankliniella occidentalis TaxID=133901 RepID=A0A6J1SBP5_FRAOC|nr:supporter of activation of yellow protein isoform X1 [Frankliniella occidentalis]